MTNDLQQARVEAAAKALFEESQGLDQDNDWNDPLPDEWRNEWKYVAGEVLAAADAHLPTVEQIAEAIEYAADWEHGFRDPEKVIAHIAETIRALFGEVAGNG